MPKILQQNTEINKQLWNKAWALVQIPFLEKWTRNNTVAIRWQKLERVTALTKKIENYLQLGNLFRASCVIQNHVGKQTRELLQWEFKCFWILFISV